MKKFFSTLTLTTATALTVALTGGAMSSDSVLGQTSIDLATLRSAAVSKHNTYRATHKSPNITISDSLNSSAQAWAEKIASSGEFEHSTNRNNVGENIYASYSTQSTVDPTTLGNTAVKEWYDEIKDYNYANPGFSSETGHFTQVVWKGSTQLGCGAAQGTATIEGTNYNAFYVVCQYAPAGNVQGQFPDNVLKP
ncbi:secretion protein [Nostoc sp. FACHB-973]|uniref:Secretion protein n=1 Tax=Desmonostoc muscorum LEGE 12446 TaxID=1828758 RepID=A0A8J6ZTI7_DESMC|nr:CAP family protein [Desmonostoc muscorum]MBD2518829.1 secretion protein [Nostoc sp. FACHB-973]MCF2150688.1 CAP family protein [Desmonostoc muscorum LEGE 12446]